MLHLLTTVLKLLKLDLGITSNARDEYFNNLLESCKKDLEGKGIVLEENADDMQLLSDYSAWAYRKRQEDVPISNNLKHRIRNRIVKVRAGNG